MIEFILNNNHVYTDFLATTVLLDFIRSEKRLTGAKEGCREGDCGACTVLIGEIKNRSIVYKSVNSCLMPLGEAHGKHVVTVEGFNQEELSPIQYAIVDEGGTQCGFCTPGFVVSMTGYFLSNKKIDVDDAVESLGGNICRCTGYAGIKRAVEKTVTVYEQTSLKLNHLDKLITAKFIPDYFKTIKKNLEQIRKNGNLRKSNTKYFIGGGTDLYVQQWEELIQSEALFASQEKIPNEILQTKNKIKIGGAATIQQVLESHVIKKHLPSLNKQLELFGSLPIRNRATVAGNIVNASPIGDITNILLALEAKLHLKGKRSGRDLFLREFYKGYKLLDKKRDEIVEWISFQVPSKKILFNFEKISKRTYLDIASVNSTIILEVKKDTITKIGLSAGGVAPIPLHLNKTCEFLIDKLINTENVKAAVEIAMQEISPISDARGSAEYKRLLLRQLFFSHFIKLFPQQINAEELL